MPCSYLGQIRSEEGVGAPGTGVTYAWELPHGSWGLNPGPLNEHLVLFNIGALSPVSSLNGLEIKLSSSFSKIPVTFARLILVLHCRHVSLSS